MLKKKSFIVFTSILFVFFLFNLNNFLNINKKKFISFDEVNLLYAANNSLFNIWLGKDTINFKEFIQIGKKKIEKKKINETTITRQSDGFFLRNHHGILNLYLYKFEKKNKFEGLKISNFFVIILIILSFVYILKKLKVNFFIATNIIIFIISTPWFLYSSLTTTNNLLLGFSVLIMGFFLFEYEKKTKIKKIYFLTFGMVISILSLETSIFFIFFFLAYIFLKYKRKINLLEFFKLKIFLLLAILILYPAFYINLDLIKSLLMLFYRIFFDNTLSFHQSSLSLINDIFIENYLFYLLILILIFLLKISNKIKLNLLILFFLGIFYKIFLLPNLFHVSYLFPGFILMSLFFILNYEKIYTYINKNNILTIFILAIFFSSQLNFYNDNKKNNLNKNNFFEKLTGHSYSLKMQDDLLLIDDFIKKNLDNKYINIYSDFPNLFILKNMNLKDKIKNSYVSNDHIIIEDNYDKLGFKEINQSIFILQKRLVSKEVEKKIYMKNYKIVNLDIKNFIVFKNYENKNTNIQKY